MQKKYVILILLIIFFLVILSVKCSENFESSINNKPLITDISNTLYCVNYKDEMVVLSNYNEKSDCAKIYELYDLKNEKIYNLYLNDKILKYIDNKNIKFLATNTKSILSNLEYFRLYKTPNNKLYYIINNQNKYLSLDANNYLVISDKEENGIIWILN